MDHKRLANQVAALLRKGDLDRAKARLAKVRMGCYCVITQYSAHAELEWSDVFIRARSGAGVLWQEVIPVGPARSCAVEFSWDYLDQLGAEEEPTRKSAKSWP